MSLIFFLQNKKARLPEQARLSSGVFLTLDVICQHRGKGFGRIPPSAYRAPIGFRFQQ